MWIRGKQASSSLVPWEGQQLVGVDGIPQEILGIGSVLLQLRHTTFRITVVIADSLTVEGIFGLDFLEKHKCVIDTGHQTLLLPEGKLTLPLATPKTPTVNQCAVVLPETICIPPSSELEVLACTNSALSEDSYLLEPNTSTWLPVRASRALVTPTEMGVVVRLLNSRPEAVKSTVTLLWDTIDTITVTPITQRTSAVPPQLNIVSTQATQTLSTNLQDAYLQPTEMKLVPFSRPCRSAISSALQQTHGRHQLYLYERKVESCGFVWITESSTADKEGCIPLATHR